MENLGEQRPQSPGYRAIDDKRLDAPDYISYIDKLAFWPKATAGYRELTLKRLKRDRELVLGSVPKPESSGSQKMDANEVVLRMMVKEKLQKKEICHKRYESVIETETEAESESDSESESESESVSESGSESDSDSDSESDSDSDSHSYSDGDWEWVHYYDFELYPGD